ncbi:Cobalamin synthesis protein P47K [Balamuthia mandrillaris]
MSGGLFETYMRTSAFAANSVDGNLLDLSKAGTALYKTKLAREKWLHGMALLKEGRYVEASEELAAAFMQDEKGMVLSLSDDSVKRLVEEHLEDKTTLPAVVLRCLTASNEAESLSVLSEGVELHPRCAYLHWKLGSQLPSPQTLVRLRYLDRAIQLDPEGLPEAWIARALAYFAMGRLNSALQDLVHFTEHFLEDEKSMSAAWLYRALALIRLSELAEALTSAAAAHNHDHHCCHHHHHSHALENGEHQHEHEHEHEHHHHHHEHADEPKGEEEKENGEGAEEKGMDEEGRLMSCLEKVRKCYEKVESLDPMRMELWGRRSAAEEEEFAAQKQRVRLFIQRTEKKLKRLRRARKKNKQPAAAPTRKQPLPSSASSSLAHHHQGKAHNNLNTKNNKTALSKGKCVQCQKEMEVAALKVCAGCKMVNYCGRECQRSHWASHKLICRQLAAAASAASSS